MTEVANAATEIVAEVAEEVAEQATHVAQVSRGLSGRSFSLAFGGFVVGAGLGGTLGYIFAQRKLETKYNQIAAEEIAEMRQHYAAKVVALENTVDKPKLEELVREQGYSRTESVEPPMAVTPPSAVVDRAQEIAEAEDEAAGEPPEPESAPNVVTPDEVTEPEIRNVFQENQVMSEWDISRELAKRSPSQPYIIHRDEREEHDAYDNVTFTYYEADDVVCNERDEVVSEEDRDRILGEENLGKFGHGSGDSSIVYIRNDQLEMDIEVVHSPNSYSEEVHGFQHSDTIRRRPGRTSFDDE